MIIKTKLNTPTINRKFVQRENIAQKLQQIVDYKLTLVTAPAGFGKTTTVAGYLWNSGILHTWLSIDEDDNDPVKFWRYMVAALDNIISSCDLLTGIPINIEVISSGILAGLLIDRLYSIPGKALIVLDDYHLVHNELVHESLAYFVKYLPNTISVIILSREELDNQLGSAYARGRVLKMGVEDLSFSSDETTAFFEHRGLPLQPEEISIIQDYTEGWVAGLVVAALSIEESPDLHAAVRQFSGHNRYIDCFIRDEVFNNWSNDIKDFLVQTSFLNKLNGSLCQAVTGDEEAAEVLKRLAEGNSLLFHLDQEDNWFRYHHLFQEFLQSKLEEKAPDFPLELHRRAGQWYQDNGFHREAIEAFIKAGAYLEAFILLVDPYIYLEMAQNGELTEWCRMSASIPDGYPEGYLKEKVQSCLAHCWALSMEGRLEEAEIWLNKGQTHFEQLNNIGAIEKQYLLAHIVMAKATMDIVKMDAEHVQCYIKEASSIDLYQTILLGELNTGEPQLLNTIYGFKGRLNKIMQCYGPFITDLPRIIGDFSAYATLTLAECYYERNNLKAAYQTMIQAMESISDLNSPGAIVPCFITLARIKRAQGDMPGAFETVAAGKNKLVEKKQTFWDYYLNVFMASLFIDLEDIASAEEWLDISRISIYDNLSCSREFEYIVLARYLILQKQYDDSLLLLKRLEAFAIKENRLGSQVRLLGLMAINQYWRGNLSEALAALDTALQLGMDDGYVRIFIDELEPMAELLTEYPSWKGEIEEDEKYRYAASLLQIVNDNINIFRAKNPPRPCPQTKKDMTAGLLSPREYRVLRLLAAERSNKQIAEELGITVRTVKYHNSRIFEKLGVKNRLEAIVRTIESDLLR